MGGLNDGGPAFRARLRGNRGAPYIGVFVVYSHALSDLNTMLVIACFPSNFSLIQTGCDCLYKQFVQISFEAIKRQNKKDTRTEFFEDLDIKLSNLPGTQKPSQVDTGAEGNIFSLCVFCKMFPHKSSTSGQPLPGAPGIMVPASLNMHPLTCVPTKESGKHLSSTF